MTRDSLESTVFQQLAEYLLIEEIGESTLFRVFRARHSKLQRDVIVKFLRDPNSGNRDVLARFRREMQAVGGLAHENIVWATDAGEHAGTPFIVMEYLPGRTLNQVVAEHGPLRIADACELGRQTALGLDFIHARHLIHRDVKPSNVLLTQSGSVKLLDFGLVRFADQNTEGEELTAAATALGTPDYIAPEQARDSRAVDARADIYSLGCTLFELLTGAPPFAGAEFNTAVKKVLAHSQRRPSSVAEIRSDVPRELSQLIDRMLAKAAGDRPATAAAVVDVLTPLAAGHRLPELLQAIEGSGAAAPSVARPTTAGSALVETRNDGAAADNRRSWAATPLLLTTLLLTGAAAIVLMIGAYFVWNGWTERQPSISDNKPPDQRAVEPDESAFSHRDTNSRPPANEADSKPPPAAPRTPQAELDELRQRVAAVAGIESVQDQRELKDHLVSFWNRQCGTPEQLQAAELLPQLLWPADMRHPGDIPREERDSSGKNPLDGPPPELVAVYGSGRLRHWLSVREIAFSPDGTMLATPGLDGVVMVWNTKSGEPIERLQSDVATYEAAAFTRDGKTLVAATSSAWFHVWDVAGWKFRKAVKPQGPRFAGQWSSAWATFSPDASLLLAAGQQKTLQLCDSQTGNLKETWRGHAAAIKCVAFSADGRTAVSGDDGGTVIVWDAAVGTLRKKIEPGHGAIWSVALTRDAGLLAAGHADGVITIARPETDEPLRVLKVAGSVGALSFSPGGERLLVGAGGASTGLRELDVEDGRVRRTLDFTSTWCHFPRYSPDGSTIACGYWDGAVGLWDAESGAPRCEPGGMQGETGTVAVSPDGMSLAAGRHQSQAIIWSVESGLPGNPVLLGFWPRTLNFAGGSDRLFATASYGPSGTRTAGIWNLETLEREQSVQLPGSRYPLAAPAPAFDGSFVVSVDEKNTISVWELSGRERLLLRNQAVIEVLAVSPDGRYFASAGSDERVHVWDARTGDERWTLLTTGLRGTALAFSPDGNFLACGTSDSKIRLWRCDSGDVTIFSGHEPTRFGVQKIAFNPAGTLLASCSGDGTLRIWNPGSPQSVRTISVGPPHALILDLTFLPDGRHVATANFNGTVYLLRLESR